MPLAVVGELPEGDDGGLLALEVLEVLSVDGELMNAALQASKDVLNVLGVLVRSLSYLLVVVIDYLTLERIVAGWR